MQLSTRRLSTPDSLALCFVKASGDVVTLSALDGMILVKTSGTSPESLPLPDSVTQAGVRKAAQQILRDRAATREPSAKSVANLALLLTASLQEG